MMIKFRRPRNRGLGGTRMVNAAVGDCLLHLYFGEQRSYYSAVVVLPTLLAYNRVCGQSALIGQLTTRPLSESLVVICVHLRVTSARVVDETFVTSHAHGMIHNE
jgi:hypothetical protein